MKILVENYTFNSSLGQVTFSDFAAITIDSVLLITNVTDNIIIYQFNNPLKSGTVATNVLSLLYDVSGMDNGDALQIFYDDTVLLPALDARYTIACDYSGDNLIYFGRALPGSSKASSLWQVRKLTYSGALLTDIQWADGDQLYDNVWDNRAGFSYS